MPVVLYAGLMSGTSVDGVDAVLLEISDARGAAGQRFLVRAATHTQYPASLAARLQAAIADPQSCRLDELGHLDAAVGEVFADAAMHLFDFSGFAAQQVRAIGSHGQTLLHRPRGAPAFTMQIGDANRIAERTGVDVVADFRRRDMAAGGEGAPLVPAFHAAAFGIAGATRVMVNIGGIANITVLAADGGVKGFDTGPGNCLMDLWSRQHLGAPFDKEGALAASAAVHPELLRRLLTEPYLALAAPKSTGRELFRRELLDTALRGLDATVATVQSTLCQYTAVTIVDAISRIARAQPAELLVCGGGAYNAELMRRLASLLARPVHSTAQYGIAPQHVEAAAFAWLAHQYVQGQPGNLTAVTGARGPRVLGALYAGGVTKP
ncbi:MAG: anhydro-N-acetylmuramic acid kinase [Pseudomonadota bacterium]